MNILIIGSGSREHAFAWKIHNSKSDVNIYVTNPNAGMIDIVTPLNIDINNFNLIKESIIQHEISLVLVGPEIPLIMGITDFIINDKDLRNVKVIGPSELGAKLEGSKEFAKNFMKKYNIPTGSYNSFTKESLNDGISFIKNSNPPYVLKADGPAAGKGVIIVNNVNNNMNFLLVFLFLNMPKEIRNSSSLIISC